MSTTKKVHIAVCDPYLNTKGGGEKCAIATAETLSKLANTKVSLLVYDDPKKFNKKELEQYFKADLSKVEIVQVKNDKKLIERLHKYHARWPLMVRHAFSSYIEYKAFREHNIDVFINNFYKSSIFNPAPVGIYFCMFPQVLAAPTAPPKNIFDRYYRKGINWNNRRLSIKSEPYQMLGTYQKVLSISSFTQKWVRNYWGVDADIIYPICEDMHKPGIKKEKIILNVGRFFAPSDNNHQKKQDVLLETFLEMKDLHNDGWELHFAGGIARDTEAMEYALKLVMKAKGYPVYFHFGTPFENLQSLYNRATIYWHATGYGVDEEAYPEQQEHFGITTVEAMSAGVIPIVLNAAGQKDTVVQGESGYLWDTLRQLKNFTTQVSKARQSQLTSMRAEAVERSTRFNKVAYQSSITTAVSEEAAKAGFILD